MPNKHNRVGIAGTVYHQLPGCNPTSSSLRCTTSLQTREEAFSRSPPNPVGQGWQKLDLGWLPSCFMLCIKSLEKIGGQEIEIGVILPLGNCLPHILDDIVPLHLVIPPGMVTVLYPTTDLALRCIGGEAQYTLFAVPE